MVFYFDGIQHMEKSNGRFVIGLTVGIAFCTNA